MRIAAHGMISDTGVSSAGSYPKLLRILLEQGHQIDFYGYRRFTEPKSLESLPGYRFRPFMVGWNVRVKLWLNEHPSRYAEVLRSTLAHIAFQREAVRAMEASGVPYDFALCLDVPNLWKSRFPMLSWPQGPPHTEWSALRRPEIARSVIEGDGHLYYAAVQAFYAARWVQGKIALDQSDLFMVASPWARDRWIDFGLDPDRVKLAPYPIELESLEQVPTPTTNG